MIPLTTVPPGEKVRVKEIRGNRGMQSRLAALGFLPGTEIEAISSGRPGPMIVLVRGGRVALGQGMARRIMVDTGIGDGTPDHGLLARFLQRFTGHHHHGQHRGGRTQQT